ncbi:MAG TPA: hypothetical protein VF443_12840, partial [Nitrospira sp.]
MNHPASLKASTPNTPQDRSTLWGILASRCRLYWLRFAVQEVIHHDDVMCPIIIWPRGSVAARDPHSGNTRVGKDDAEEGQTSIAGRGRDKAAEDQPPINPEALDARAGLAVS